MYVVIQLKSKGKLVLLILKLSTQDMFHQLVIQMKCQFIQMD